MDSHGLTSILPEGWMVGVMYIVFESWDEIYTCMKSCNSYTLIAERALTFLCVFVGAASPGQLVYSHLKNLIDAVLEKYTGSPLQENSPVEHMMKSWLFFLGVTGLENIWDYIRESSMCLKFNNCTHDFLQHTTALKLSWCGENKTRKADSDEPLPFCDQIFVDSPLFLLALLTVILTAFSNLLRSDSGFIHHSLDDEMQEFKTGKPSDDKKSVPNINGFSPGRCSHESSSAAEQNEDNSGSGGSNGYQIFYADCPDCQQAHAVKVPNPLVVACTRKANDTSSSPSSSDSSTAYPVCPECGQQHSI